MLAIRLPMTELVGALEQGTKGLHVFAFPTSGGDPRQRSGAAVY